MRIHSQKGVFMNWIKSERFLRYSEGRAIVLAYIEMDSSADLPAVNTFTGRIISIGSYAHDIESGETYCLNSLNEWIKQKSGEVFFGDSVMLGNTAGETIIGNFAEEE